jgi:hypothetical protein
VRAKTYSRILVAATIVTLLGTTLAPDVTLPFTVNPFTSRSAAATEERLFNAIAWPPQVLARSLGIWIDSHSAQVWPPGWPMFAAFALRLSFISIPFWFVTGVLAFEIALVCVRLAQRLRGREIDHRATRRENEI